MGWQDRRSGWVAQPEDARLPADVDYARIIHSASFRALQGKPQILNLGDSDFYRTRLTHSLEVAQIAGGLVRQFTKQLTDHPVHSHLPTTTLVQAIGATHDLGHPPFGHGGEVALNFCLRDRGGFEGNGQTLRILTRLEKMSASDGADLSRRTLLGVLKYPAPYSSVLNPDLRPGLAEGPATVSLIDRKRSVPPKCYLDAEAPAVDWILAPFSDADRERFTRVELRPKKHGRTLSKSLDCSIMDLADDIAYGVHDLEDAIALGLVQPEAFRNAVPESACSSFLDSLKSKYPTESSNNVYAVMLRQLFGSSSERKHYVGRLVHHFVTNAIVVVDEAFEHPLLRYRVSLDPRPAKLLDALKAFVRDQVILSPEVQHLEMKGQRLVVAVFEALQSDPHMLLPRAVREEFIQDNEDPRVIADYLASMTDGFLLKTYDRLYSPRMGSVFDRL